MTLNTCNHIWLLWIHDMMFFYGLCFTILPSIPGSRLIWMVECYLCSLWEITLVQHIWLADWNAVVSVGLSVAFLSNDLGICFYINCLTFTMACLLCCLLLDVYRSWVPWGEQLLRRTSPGPHTPTNPQHHSMSEYIHAEISRHSPCGK